MFRPMLPKNLTALISLREGVRSPAHSVLFTIRESDGVILSVRRCHSFVKIAKRLTYGDVQNFLDNPKRHPADWTSTLRKHLQRLAETVRKLRANRLASEQFLSIDTVEIRVLCDEETHEVTGIARKTQSEADQLVEECMLAANSAVAEELVRARIPGLFRIHPEPFPAKIDEFSAFAAHTFHLKTGDILSGRTACRHFLDNIPDDHRKPIILSRFLRALPRASYADAPALHYGLGKNLYSHFTSPIRRYPDLLVHQQLLAYDLHKPLRSQKTISAFASECSDKEENNDNAWYAANDRLKLHYLKAHSDENAGVMHEAVICKISPQGLLCDIPELGLYGFVPTAFLRGGSFRRSLHKTHMRAERGHAEFRIGDFIYLVLDSLDLAHGSAVFRPAL